MDFTHYLERVASDLKAGNATEHTHRPALQTLLESSLPGIKATNEPRRIACGAPDYIVTRGETPIGYIEAKDIGASLDAVQGDEQLKRYRAALRNLILTDYLEFRLYRNGELVQTAKLAQLQTGGAIKKIATGAANTAACLRRAATTLVAASRGWPRPASCPKPTRFCASCFKTSPASTSTSALPGPLMTWPTCWPRPTWAPS